MTVEYSIPDTFAAFTSDAYVYAAPAGSAPAAAGDGAKPKTAMDLYLEQMQAQQAAQAANARASASAWLADILRQYGLDALAGQVDSLVQEWGANTDVIALKLRQTDAYKERFAGLLALQQKGVTDIRNEAEYLQTESAYRQVFRDAGLRDYLGAAGSKDEQAAIAKLVGDYSVSVDEVRQRVLDAQRVVGDTNPEVRDALQRYYNVSAQDLVAYTLDPAKNKDRINQIANAAITGGYAQRYGLNADLGTAEQIASLSQGNDVSLQNLSAQLSSARDVRDATGRLASIESTDLTDSEILGSEFNTSTDAQRKIKTLQSRERARFGGGSAIGRDTLKSTAGF